MVAELGTDSIFTAPKTMALAALTFEDTATFAHSPKYIDPNTLQKKRVYFEKEPCTADSSNLKVLYEIGQMLHDQPQKRIYLNSYSEGAGDGVVNYQLSVVRAKSLRAWLVQELGLPAQQIVVRAYGEAFPEFANDNDLRNRRITFEYAPADAQDNVF